MFEHDRIINMHENIQRIRTMIMIYPFGLMKLKWNDLVVRRVKYVCCLQIENSIFTFTPVGYSMKIYAIDNGRVSMHLKSPNFNNNLPIIPSEMSCVNFTWRSGTKKYYYNFDRLQSLDETILKPPTVSIKNKGKVPQESKGLFSKTFLIEFHSKWHRLQSSAYFCRARTTVPELQCLALVCW